MVILYILTKVDYYIELIDKLSEGLDKKLQDGLPIEMIFMTYGTAHKKINVDL